MSIHSTLRTVCLLFSCIIAPFVTAQAAEEFTVIQMCDTQLGMGGYEHDVDAFNKAVLEINAMAPDLVVICGDLVDRPDAKSFKDFNEIRAKFTVPCYPAPGNHDVGQMPTAATLANYRKVVGDDYYAVEHKGYNFLIVNTQLWKKDVPEASAKHQAWFSKTLKESHAKGNMNIVVGHYPIFVDTPDEEEQYYNLPMPFRQELMTLCKEQGVVAYMTGHAHKNIVREFEGIPMVVSATSSRNFDGAPMGYRVWTLGSKGELAHEFVHIQNLDESLVPKPKPKK